MATPADGQLRLDIGGERQDVDGSQEIDLVDAYLAAHAGDARAAIRELLLDADFLRDQLALAAGAMSSGMTRGWRPKYERVSP